MPVVPQSVVFQPNYTPYYQKIKIQNLAAIVTNILYKVEQSSGNTCTVNTGERKYFLTDLLINLSKLNTIRSILLHCNEGESMYKSSKRPP